MRGGLSVDTPLGWYGRGARPAVQKEQFPGIAKTVENEPRAVLLAVIKWLDVTVMWAGETTARRRRKRERSHGRSGQYTKVQTSGRINNSTASFVTSWAGRA